MDESTFWAILNLVLSVVIYGSIVGFLIWAILNHKKQRQRRIAACVKFSAAHGTTFYGESAKSPNYRGMLFGTSSHLVSGVDVVSKRNLEMFQLMYVTGSGKSRREYLRTVVALSIKKTGVHVFVNSRLNDAKEQVSLDKAQRYAAEGNFSKFFDIYMADGTQLVSLSLFAPDVMSLIMAGFGEFDMEIVDDTLYLYQYERHDKSDGLERLYQYGVKLAAALDDNAPTKPHGALANGDPDASAVTGLKRRNPAKMVALIFIPMMFLSIFMGIFSQSGGVRMSVGNTGQSVDLIMVFFGLLQVAAPIFALIVGSYTLVKRDRLQKKYHEARQSFAKDHNLPIGK